MSLKKWLLSRNTWRPTLNCVPAFDWHWTFNDANGWDNFSALDSAPLHKQSGGKIWLSKHSKFFLPSLKVGWSILSICSISFEHSERHIRLLNFSIFLVPTSTYILEWYSVPSCRKGSCHANEPIFLNIFWRNNCFTGRVAAPAWYLVEPVNSVRYTLFSHLADPERPEAGPRPRAATAARPAPFHLAARDGHPALPLIDPRLPRGQDLRRGQDAGVQTETCHQVCTKASCVEQYYWRLSFCYEDLRQKFRRFKGIVSNCNFFMIGINLTI